MAHLFDKDERFVPTWMAAARHLNQLTHRSGRNLLLEISQPTLLLEDDRRVLNVVDQALKMYTDNLSIETVAGTIFPHHLCLRSKSRKELYDRYQRILGRAKRSWGTYFDRMTNRLDKSGQVINPLEQTIQKLARSAKPGTQTLQSAYEICVSNLDAEFAESVEMGCEISTYDPANDRGYTRGGPCLSHVSFKLTHGTHVDLTAMYRSHHYCSRALGNLLGLSRLLTFVAGEAGLQVGVLSCLSTHAELDVAAWKNAATAKKILEEL